MPSSDAGGSYALLSLMWSTEILLLIGLAPVHQKRARTDEAREYFVFIWHTEV